MEWYMTVLKKYAVFSGRARRKEYWMFTLVNTIIISILSILGSISNGSGAGMLFGALFLFYCLAMIVPNIAVSVRRLHDTNRSGWFLLLYIIPVVAMIVFVLGMFLFVLSNNFTDSNSLVSLIGSLMGSLIVMGIIFLLLECISLVVSIIFLVFMVLDGTPGDNRYGPNPKESEGQRHYGVYR